MKRTIWVLPAAVFPVALITLSCLIQEEIHTLYLTPEGSVTWTVLEKDVRSDSDDPAAALKEEEEFLDKAWTADQPAAARLRKFSPESVRTRVLRDERPFIVMTEAHFASAATMVQSLLESADLRGDAELQSAGGRTRLVMRVYPPPEEETADQDNECADAAVQAQDGQDAPDPDAASLTDSFEDYKVVLTRGRFVEGHGFRISPDRQEARVEVTNLKEHRQEDGALAFWLTWESGGTE